MGVVIQDAASLVSVDLWISCMSRLGISDQLATVLDIRSSELWTRAFVKHTNIAVGAQWV